jgi:hypothetical protein
MILYQVRIKDKKIKNSMKSKEVGIEQKHFEKKIKEKNLFFPFYCEWKNTIYNPAYIPHTSQNTKHRITTITLCLFYKKNFAIFATTV